MSEQEQRLKELAVYKYGFRDEDAAYEFVVPKGLSREVVEAISHYKNEPDWMRRIRLQGLEIFFRKPLPTWGADLSELNFDEITYYAAPTKRKFRSWDEVPEYIKRTYERLGIPEAERKFLAGVGAQYDSEVVYHRIREDLERQGVIFVDMDTAVREYPDIVKEYFGTVIPPTDNKFAALNTAVWSGGSFVYVPAGVHVEMPLQAYFRINAENIGQFERTLIIAEEGSFVHYIEGCLPAGEQISVGDRWVNIEAVKPSDFVVTATGEKRRVRAVMTRHYKGDLIEVVPVSPHNAFRLTPEHPVLAVRREDVAVRRKRRDGRLPEVDTAKLLHAQPTYIPVGELKVGDFIVFPKVKPGDFNPAFTDEQLRLLGYYLAKGTAYVHTKLNQSVVTFTFGEHEKDAIEEVKALVRKVTGKRAQVVRLPHRHAVDIRVGSRELVEFCLRYAGKGSETKQLSPEIMALPPEQIKPLLDAYFIGDGNVCVKKGRSAMKQVSTASLTLARQIQELLARMGVYASILERKSGNDVIQGRQIRRKDRFLVVWTENKRWSAVRDAGDYFLVPVKAIRRIPYDGLVFNLHVEHPNAYLVRGFVAHNCTAPIYSTNSLHSAVVELIAKPGATIRYTTLQNWSHNVYNLVTKRGVAYEDAKIIWVDANIGCVCEGELVYTEHGRTPIEAVEPGTKVWSFDEATKRWVLRPVVARKFSGLKQVYEVVFSNGRTVRLTDNHPLLAIRYDPTRPKESGRYTLRWTPLSQLTVGDAVIVPTALPSEGQLFRLVRPNLPEKVVGRDQRGYEIQTRSRLPVALLEEADEDVCETLRPSLTDGLQVKLRQPHRVKNYRQTEGIRPTCSLSDDTGITRIVAIRPSVIAPTYDLEIEGTSNFVVNGILLHNSKVTMKYPCVYMVGKGARGEVLSVAFASSGQHQDAGAKMIHAAPYTTSVITSKSISVFGGRATYRGMVKVYPNCKGAKVNVRCDALLLDEISRTDTYPVMEIEEEQVEVAHEATVSKIGEEQLFYLQSRGLTDDQAIKMIVNGFFRDFAKELPMEYAVEFTRLIELQLEGSVG